MEEIRLNKSLYSIDVIFSAAYILIDKAYFLFDEENGKYIVKIESKKEKSSIVNEFKEELLNYLNYNNNIKETKKIRELILKRALLLGEIDENNTE